MNGRNNIDVKVVAWDPKSPATLLVPTIVENDSEGADTDQNKSSNMVMNYTLCDNGSGCNTFESSAIMNLLDARDASLDELKSSSTNGARCHYILRQLSAQYRRALDICIGEWSEDFDKRKEMSMPEKQEQEEAVALYLLRATAAITHLSEIFLLLPRSQEGHNGLIDHMGYSGYQNGVMNLPGAVTADTVRYLRKHHFSDIEDTFGPSVIEDLYQLWTPDQNSYDSSEGNIYWEVLEAYMVRGCLEDAWALLSHHSIVRRFVEMEEDQFSEQQNDSNTSATTPNSYRTASLAEDREGFKALRDVLLSAPLPGSRNDNSDEGFDDKSTNRDDDEIESNGNNNHVSAADEEFIEGISTSAYRLWETGDTSRPGDYYVNFEPHAASQVHKYWKQAIGQNPPLQRLRKRIPQLNRLLALLVGDFRDIQFASWQEEFCAELLYKNPDIQPVDIHLRAAALLQKYESISKNSMNDDDGRNDAIDEMVLTIMKSNAGEAVKAMHGFGGGSGAALPAVMTSLLSQLLQDANVLSQSSDVYDNTEQLIEASSAIRSSLAMEGFHDLGTRLAVRLLMPHIEIDSDLRITATLVNTLEHHSPKSDAEAKGLLSLCRKLVERRNVRVLDGCVSICLARYLYYIDQRIPGGAVHWLLVGMDLEALVLCGDRPDWQRPLASGVCYRKLVEYFSTTSRLLLKMLLGEEKGASLFYDRAKEMVSATKDESSDTSHLAQFVPDVKLLEHIIIIAGAIVERKETTIVANSIISCLEEKPNDEDDGVVSSLARSLSWDFLRLAVAILEMDAKRAESKRLSDRSAERPISSFDVRGMGILLSTITVETKAHELKEQSAEKPAHTEEKEVMRMRLVLAEGLKRAFVAENAMKREARRRSKKSDERILTVNYHKHSIAEQEEAVRLMLAP